MKNDDGVIAPAKNQPLATRNYTRNVFNSIAFWAQKPMPLPRPVPFLIVRSPHDIIPTIRRPFTANVRRESAVAQPTGVL